MRVPTSDHCSNVGNRGSVACCNGDVCEQGIYDADTIGRLGGGDAFSAGFLCSYLSGHNVKESLRWASAAASLKYSIPGDLPLFDRSEVEKLLVSERVNSMVR